MQSRIKALERMAEVEVTEKDPEYVFTFPDPGAAIPAPIVGFHDVDFNYPGGKTLFKGLNFGLVSRPCPLLLPLLPLSASYSELCCHKWSLLNQ